MMNFTAIEYHANSIYECENKENLIKYYHASIGSHPTTTLIVAAKAGYLKGCLGLNAETIRKYIAVEDATKIGFMKQIQQGVKSNTTK